jgi:hypothetical protein
VERGSGVVSRRIDLHKNVVKMTFAKGAALDDPSGLFNSSLDGNTRRAIDFHKGEKIDEEALKALNSRGRDAERVPRPRLIELKGKNKSLGEGAIRRFQCWMPFVTQSASGM